MKNYRKHPPIQIFLITAVMSIAITISGAIVRSSQNNEEERNVDKQVAFWHAVDTGNTDTLQIPASTFAADLHDLLGPDSDGPLPEEVLSFEGSSNLYGGISEAIGFNPFAGSNCEECGPLNAGTLHSLESIHHAGVEELGLVTHPRQIHFWVPLFAMFMTGTLMWFVAGAISRDDFSWSPTWWLMAPVCMAVYQGMTKLKERRSNKKLWEQFPGQMELLERVDRTLRLQPNEELLLLRSSMERELYAQLKSSDTDTETLDDLTEQVKEQTFFLIARLEAKKALN